MSCEHAETTTLLWLYGEAPEEHADHVARCEACREVSAMHADVVSMLPVMPRTGPVAVPEPANRSGWAWAGTLAMAAAALLVFGLGRMPTTTDPGMPAVAPVTSPLAYADWQAPLTDLSDELDLLDAELADLERELANL